MAEGFFRKYGPIGYESQSAGTLPSDRVNPIVVQAMSEIGIDITVQTPKTISDSMIKNASMVINMGCIDQHACPALTLDDVSDWKITDPKGKSLDDVRKIRDQIKQKVEDLCKHLE